MRRITLNRLQKQRFWLAIASFVTPLLISLLYFSSQGPSYTTSAELTVNVTSAESLAALNEGTAYINRQMDTYLALPVSASVLESVANEPGVDASVDTLRKNVSVSQPPSANIFAIKYVDSSPLHSANYANAIAKEVVDTIHQLTPPIAGRTRSISAFIVSPARAPETQSLTSFLASRLPVPIVLSTIFAASSLLLFESWRQRREFRNRNSQPTQSSRPRPVHSRSHLSKSSETAR